MNSLKKLTLAIIAIISFQSLSAQKIEWKELKNFHGVMSKTFHPAENDNLQPVKDSASVLLVKAIAWEAAPVPAEYAKKDVKKILTALVAKCDELNKAVIAKKSDADLKKLITEAHEIFHQIVEKCHGPDSEK